MNSRYLVWVAVLAFSSLGAYADIVYPMDREDRDYNTTATEKLDRGIQNLLYFPLEVPHTIWYNASRDRYDGRGFFKGTADGIRNAGVRLGQGLFDTFTFPWNTGSIQVPWDPPPPVLHPEWISFVDYVVPGADYVDQDFREWPGEGAESMWNP